MSNDTAYPARAIWRKSAFSANNGTCVGLSPLPYGLIGVRDSKEQRCGQVLRLDHTAWGSFLADITTARRASARVAGGRARRPRRPRPGPDSPGGPAAAPPR